MPTIDRIGKKPKDKQRRQTERRRSRKSVYNSSRWKEQRLAYLQLHPICERCGKALATEIHHRKPFLNGDGEIDGDLAYGTDNLQALCKQCHIDVHLERAGKSDKLRLQREIADERERQRRIRELTKGSDEDKQLQMEQRD